MREAIFVYKMLYAFPLLLYFSETEPATSYLSSFAPCLLLTHQAINFATIKMIGLQSPRTLFTPQQMEYIFSFLVSISILISFPGPHAAPL